MPRYRVPASSPLASTFVAVLDKHYRTLLHAIHQTNKQIHSARDSWLEMEKQALEDFLPVEAAGSGNASVDYRFIAASVRQQRLFARSMELRLGEYMGRYDNERMLAVEGAYRDGDIERVSVLCCAVLGCFAGGSSPSSPPPPVPLSLPTPMPPPASPTRHFIP